MGAKLSRRKAEMANEKKTSSKETLISQLELYGVDPEQARIQVESAIEEAFGGMKLTEEELEIISNALTVYQSNFDWDYAREDWGKVRELIRRIEIRS